MRNFRIHRRVYGRTVLQNKFTITNSAILMEISLFNVTNESTYIINNFNRAKDYVKVDSIDNHSDKQFQHKVNSQEKETRADGKNEALRH